jgi:prepilin-type N-terminal cleavage/methylation domain-containing protein
MRRRGGFTLLEVMIAILIFVLAVAAIVPLFAVAVTSHKRGMDQAQVAWLAPRIAAHIQERLTEQNPPDLEGYVKEMEDGSLLITDVSSRLKADGKGDYVFKARLDPIAAPGNSGPVANACFTLTIDVYFREEGAQLIESYQTIVLRKLAR